MFTNETVTPETTVDYLRRIVRGARGDDLERATNAFGRMSETDLDKQWGQSGQTCREIWDGYKRGRERWAEANALLESLLAQLGLSAPAIR